MLEVRSENQNHNFYNSLSYERSEQVEKERGGYGDSSPNVNAIIFVCVYPLVRPPGIEPLTIEHAIHLAYMII